MASPARGTRIAVASVMTLWTLLQVATLVVAAVRGGTPSDAFRFAYTGMFAMALTALTVVAWRWVLRAERWVPPSSPAAPTARTSDPSESPPAAPPARPHRGLAGHEPPPRRW